MTEAIRDTSLEVYHKLKDYFGVQAIELYKFIDEHPNLTRNEIHKETGVKEASVCGRIKELLNEGVLKEGVQRKDYYSQNTAYTLHTINNIDWNLLDIQKLTKKETKKLSIDYELINTLYKLTNSFISKNPEAVRLGLEINDKEIVNILKLKSMSSKIVRKYF